MCDILKAGTDPTTDNKKANSEESKFTYLTQKMRFCVSSLAPSTSTVCIEKKYTCVVKQAHFPNVFYITIVKDIFE